jgi:hypothetical protein
MFVTLSVTNIGGWKWVAACVANPTRWVVHQGTTDSGNEKCDYRQYILAPVDPYFFLITSCCFFFTIQFFLSLFFLVFFISLLLQYFAASASIYKTFWNNALLVLEDRIK